MNGNLFLPAGHISDMDELSPSRSGSRSRRDSRSSSISGPSVQLNDMDQPADAAPYSGREHRMPPQYDVYYQNTENRQEQHRHHPRDHNYRQPNVSRREDDRKEEQYQDYSRSRHGRRGKRDQVEDFKTSGTERNQRDDSREVRYPQNRYREGTRDVRDQKEDFKTPGPARNRRYDSTEDRFSQDRHAREGRQNRDDITSTTSRQRIFSKFMGFKKLEELTTKQPRDILTYLSNDKNGFTDLLNQRMDDLTDDKPFMILHILCLVSESGMQEMVKEIIIDVCNSKFIDTLNTFTLNLLNKNSNPRFATHQQKREMRIPQFLVDAFTLYSLIFEKLHYTACEKLPNNVNACNTIILVAPIQYPHVKLSVDIRQQFEKLKKQLDDDVKALCEAIGGGRDLRKDGFLERVQLMHPPNDFHNLTIAPTSEDLLSHRRTFIRPNIKEGAYPDPDYYLDVHFRLLREDFVAPLRDGIRDYLQDFKDAEAGDSKRRKKRSNIKVYEDVVITGGKMGDTDLYFTIVFNIKPYKNISWEHSKRLLNGNLLCLTKNNFKTMLFASIIERKKEDLEKGRIVVKFEELVTLEDLKGNFIMAESEVYFEAYRHVLQALKTIKASEFPMERYIVKAEKEVAYPSYFFRDNVAEAEYDLSCVVDNRRVTDDYSVYEALKVARFGNNIDDDEEEKDAPFSFPDLKVPLLHPELWPTAERLALDPSQHTALLSALTKEFVVIQGPPGTGKTYLGLKIIQVLLHNTAVWQNPENSVPILVVCYTNHALDQFLEGILGFTTSIVRVGSRTRSEAISRFNLTRLRTIISQERLKNIDLHLGMRAVRLESANLKEKYDEVYGTLELLKQKKGIVHEQFLNKNGIMTDVHFRSLHKDVPKKYTDNVLILWLKLDIEYIIQPEIMDWEQWGDETQPNQTAPQNIEEISDDEFFDAEEDRPDIYFEDYEDIINKPVVIPEAEVLYGLSLDSISREINRIESAREKILECTVPSMYDDPNTREVYFMTTDVQLQRLRHHRKYLDHLLHQLPNVKEESMQYILQEENLWILPPKERLLLYAYWLQKLEVLWQKEVDELQNSYFEKSGQLKEYQTMEDLAILEKAQVIGMTTTGAARIHTALKDLKPKIVIVEEAAEVLEAHIVTSLTVHCQHLILIGDHQQLRPSTTVYKLATDYNLDISLFERMVNNGMHCEKLLVQHRMKPEIANLIVPAIYPSLQNDPCVLEYANVDGVKKNLFFISHTEKEEQVHDTASRANDHEATFLIALCRYLILQGYQASQITVLTTYTGQLFMLRKEKNKTPTSICKDVRISVVDNFQGEENDIILLSLVRSNEQSNIGFLKIENRICVALSRAKRGLYIIGNMEMLKASSVMWQKINNVLEEQNSVGSEMELYCNFHNIITPVSSATDFNKVPEGGCMNICDIVLKCQHRCKSICHAHDREHKIYQCRERCTQILCTEDHPCPKECWVQCEPCMVIMRRVLACGHVHSVKCHIDMETYLCPTPLIKTHPLCGHDITVPCYLDPGSTVCPIKCDIRLPCGHQCEWNCHPEKDPDHNMYKCMKPCAKICNLKHECSKKCCEPCGDCKVMVQKVLPCGHPHRVECFVDPDTVKCIRNCERTMVCGHPCRLKCAESCGNCQVQVKKRIADCLHEVELKCCDLPERKHCKEKCKRILSCGHACRKQCSHPCNPCKELVSTHRKSPCGHTILVECSKVHTYDTSQIEDFLCKCNKPCQTLLSCGHPCIGTCGKCLQGRIHQPCGQECGRPLVCNHRCKVKCAKSCPPCKEKCQYRCTHTKCGKKCGNPCPPCMEHCVWKCEHKQCTNRCGHKCNRDPCNEPCMEKLKCGHNCIGLCGERCPPLCRVCDKGKLTEFILYGNEEEDNARFLYLSDCKHSIEVEGLDHWMNLENEEIGMKVCPRCKTIINECFRYNNIIKTCYDDVAKVKQKLFGEDKGLSEKQRDLTEKLKRIQNFPQLAVSLINSLSRSTRGVVHMKQLPAAEVASIEFKVKVILEIDDLLIDVNKLLIINQSIDQNGKNKLEDKGNFLIKLLMERDIKISEEEMQGFNQELNRLCTLVKLYKLESLPNFQHNSNPIVTQKHTTACNILNGIERYDQYAHIAARYALNELSKALRGGLGISEKERREIVAAIGLTKGHWYKCPNGHIYAIGECGGAMQQSRCNECQAPIGGGQHRLTQGNTHAGEMDGSSHAVWSETANNMMNFIDFV